MKGWLRCNRGARRRLEIPRQQQIDFGVAMTGGQRRDRGLHVGERLDAIELAGSDERGQTGPILSSFVMAREQ